MAEKYNPAEHDLKESLIALNRVSKTVKGGRVARFAQQRPRSATS